MYTTKLDLYLTQRVGLDYRGGKPIGLNFDYMGAAEFEFGGVRCAILALSRALHAENLIATKVPIDTRAAYGAGDGKDDPRLFFHTKDYTPPTTVVFPPTKENPCRTDTVLMLPIVRGFNVRDNADKYAEESPCCFFVRASLAKKTLEDIIAFFQEKMEQVRLNHTEQ